MIGPEYYCALELVRSKFGTTARGKESDWSADYCAREVVRWQIRCFGAGKNSIGRSTVFVPVRILATFRLRLIQFTLIGTVARPKVSKISGNGLRTRNRTWLATQPFSFRSGMPILRLKLIYREYPAGINSYWLTNRFRSGPDSRILT